MKYLLIILLSSCVTTEKVTLDGSKSYDTDGRIVSYEWQVNGRVVSRDITASVPVNSTVKLIVTDDKGGIGSTTKIIQ
jgi:hypothetical protein